MKVIERSVQEIGKSFLVTLPKSWADSLKIKKGSMLKILIADKGNLSIAPEFVVEENPKEVSISFDSHFERRFFKEYFQGYEKIVIGLPKDFSESHRKGLYDYLKRFMNVQVVEETNSKIAVKCFRIDELSMEECLNRIYFLSLTVFDEILEKNDKTKVVGTRDTMSRFYYMLVMQIRRYLSEGKFTAENQIPLIRAMDFRMAAEKIQRIGELLSSLESIEDNELQMMLQHIKKYYSTAFFCFMDQDFAGALPLWNEGNAYQKKYQLIKEKFKRKKDVKRYQLVSDFNQVVRFIKEISMLVR